MVKLKRHVRNKKYRGKKRNNKSKTKIGKCKQIKEAWEDKKTLKQNLESMGLSYDVNETLKIPNTAEILYPTNYKKVAKKEKKQKMEVEPNKKSVVKELEAEAKAPRKNMFRLPKVQVKWLTYLMDKYGEDYQAMAKDYRNFYQDTPNQIRNKIKRFKKIPEQYDEYLKSKEQKMETENS